MFPHGLIGASSETPIEDDKDRDNDGQPQCQERSIPQSELTRKHIVNVQTDDFRGGARSAARQQENFIEDLEGENCPEHNGGN